MEVIISGNQSVTDGMRQAAELVFFRLSEKFKFNSPSVHFEVNGRDTSVSLCCKSKHGDVVIKSTKPDFYQATRTSSKAMTLKLSEIKNKQNLA